jgi:hypothetical protein|tara:strand:- start:126 stop:872 length:747 start_codon:yes stop_codon:yes gene_type:complete
MISTRPYSQTKDQDPHYSARFQLTPGSFLHGILNGKGCKSRESKPFYVQNHKDYLTNLEKNYKYYGVPFKKPNVEELPPYKLKSEPGENHIDYLDKVIVKLNVLKNGKVRVKILPQMAILNEKYYSKAIIPPIKNVLLALKGVGYSKEYIDNINEKHKKRLKLIESRWIKLEKYFDTPSVNSKQRKKKKERVIEKEKEKEMGVIEDEDPEEEKKDDDEPEEDEAIVVDEEGDDEEAVEDDYVSDGGDD